MDPVSSEAGIFKQSSGLCYDNVIKMCVFSVYSEVEVDCSGQGARRYHRALAITTVKKSPRRTGERPS